MYVVFKAPTPYVQSCFAEYGLRTDETGNYAALYRPYHLIGLELGISVASVALRNEPTGSSRQFIADVAAVAKKNLNEGDILDGEGGYTVYGRLLRAEDSLKQSCLPMGLAINARMVRSVAKDAILTYQDVKLDEHQLSFKLRQAMENKMR